jgi:hypothetical protein
MSIKRISVARGILVDGVLMVGLRTLTRAASLMQFQPRRVTKLLSVSDASLAEDNEHTMFAMPLEIGYTCLQFWHTIAPSSTCIYSTRCLSLNIDWSMQCLAHAPPARRDATSSENLHLLPRLRASFQAGFRRRAAMSGSIASHSI